MASDDPNRAGTAQRRRSAARAVMFIGIVTALVAVGLTVRWWIRWPGDVAEQLSILVSNGDFDRANRLLAGPAEWTDSRIQHVKQLRDDAGNVLDLPVEQWKKLFAGDFESRRRTTQDYLNGRQVLEAVPEKRSRKQLGLGNWSSGRLRVVLTVAMGRVSVSLIQEPTLNVWYSVPSN